LEAKNIRVNKMFFDEKQIILIKTSSTLMY